MSKSFKFLLSIGGLFVAVLVGAVLLTLDQKKEQSDSASCVYNQRAYFASAKAYAKKNNLQAGDPLDKTQVLWFVEIDEFKCESGGLYEWKTTIPDFSKGERPASCSLKDHQPKGTTGW